MWPVETLQPSSVGRAEGVEAKKAVAPAEALQKAAAKAAASRKQGEARVAERAASAVAEALWGAVLAAGKVAAQGVVPEVKAAEPESFATP